MVKKLKDNARQQANILKQKVSTETIVLKRKYQNNHIFEQVLHNKQYVPTKQNVKTQETA